MHRGCMVEVMDNKGRPLIGFGAFLMLKITGFGEWGKTVVGACEKYR